MRIAVSTEDNAGLASTVSGHFGRCPYFTLVDLAEGAVTSVVTVANPYYGNHQPGQVPAFIHKQSADVMLSGGMGAGAISFFQQYGVQIATGASGTVQQSIDRYLRGELSAQASCPGHQGEH
jgi:predicted Fe-Mo cluster-binding NifX family protein